MVILSKVLTFPAKPAILIGSITPIGWVTSPFETLAAAGPVFAARLATRPPAALTAQRPASKPRPNEAMVILSAVESGCQQPFSGIAGLSQDE